MIRKILAVVLLVVTASHMHAWGDEGHSMVADIAMHYLSPSVKAKVQSYLKTDTPAATAMWMDKMRNNAQYDYMKPFHFANYEKEEAVVEMPNANVIHILNLTIADLRGYHSLNAGQVKYKLRLLFHLMGDLHQPLHVGYGSDRGGNEVNVKLNGHQMKLHSLWDSGIIQNRHIELQDCLDTPIRESLTGPINVLAWAKESRAALPKVYGFGTDKNINANYLATGEKITKLRLHLAGLRLARILTEVFQS